EQASAFMAATYGRLTGKAGVCLSTLGPGATNLVTGIAHAQLGGMPVVAITGQKGIRDNLQANFQVLDVVGMMKPLTKRAVQIQTPKNIPHEIRAAFKIATTERQGVCHIELPEDIADEQVEDKFKPHHPFPVRRPIADAKAIELAADAIKKAKHPIIIVSSRAQRTRVSSQLKKFCDQTNLFVVHTQLGKGVLGDGHKNSLYAFGLHKRDYVHCVIEKSDLMIMMGYATKEHPPSVWNKHLDKKILHIDFTPAEPEVHYDPQIEVVGDIAGSLEHLGEALKGYSFDGAYCSKIKKMLDKLLFSEGADDVSFPLRPRRVVADVRKALGAKDILCLDNGIYKLWFSRHYKTHAIGTFLLDNALATMGAGLPMAMAAKMVNPGKKVLAVAGDGGFMMNSQEMETAVRYKIPIVILLLNDNAFGFIKWKQEGMKFGNFGMDLGNPDFVKYAESYGASALKVKKADELLPALEKGFKLAEKEKKPVLIECPIDYSENKKVWSEELDTLICPV
ncbi:acetolactate synthase large subunit, partial [Candidatus Woesearchaeota archaeon]|nr:acetolactate synthase large subunit [Candidatus Woesearchaeota archaeon]